MLGFRSPRIVYFILLSVFISLSACGGGDSKDNNTDSNDDNAAVIPPIDSIPDPEIDPDDVCQQSSTEINWQALMTKDCNNLSDYSLFIESSIPTTSPREPGKSYQLSTELFSNYASKYRFVFLPDNKAMQFQAQTSFDFPVGSVLVKTFALPFDTQVTTPDNEKLIETRLLIHRETGWTALTYQWQQGQALLSIAGANVMHTMNNQGESISFEYHIPNKAECKICHQVTDKEISRINPIGLKAHLLNRLIPASNGELVNQLSRWSSQGMLNGLPELDSVAQSFALSNDAASLTNRAKGYLDVNCAHCHSADGFASISGLRLNYHIDHSTFEYGVCKQPPGWDGGPKGLAYDIVPGSGERSIVHYRQTLSSPKDRMPPIGREITHNEGAELIKRWIDDMSITAGNCY
ncbi:SO2930 family diheme c-type cytochrome [Shewanella donghaensis]|uniref:SO2930 family diheme c-type cytochrome n=1 Tax=Shewanella donghaensis TaxID=238836 RepID=UPI00118375C3|nr:SO2930 family diheme c-type cytochrome [Shewanella donghaensis]